MNQMDHLANTKTALRRWMQIPDKNVAKGLRVWHGNSRNRSALRTDCGTVACFGGWVGRMPEFVEMGTRVYEASGAPYMPSSAFGHLDMWDVCVHLFGANSGLFDPRDCSPYDSDVRGTASDHFVVENRLRKHIKYLRRKAKHE